MNRGDIEVGKSYWWVGRTDLPPQIIEVTRATGERYGQFEVRLASGRYVITDARDLEIIDLANMILSGEHRVQRKEKCPRCKGAKELVFKNVFDTGDVFTEQCIQCGGSGFTWQTVEVKQNEST